MLSSVERDELPDHTKQLEDVQNFSCRLDCWLSIYDEREKSRMEVASYELASLVSSLSFGSDKIHVKECCNRQVKRLWM